MLILLLLAAPLLAGGSSPGNHRPDPASPGALSAASTASPQPAAAALSFAVVASAARADPKDVVAATVYFNNTGNQAAPEVWINVSAAMGFTFLGDTAAGNISGYPHYRFSNVPLGLHSFGMSFRVDIGVVPGIRLTVSATLVYSDGTGAQEFLGPATASVLVGVATKDLYLGWSLLAPTILTTVPPTGSLSPQGTYTLLPGGASRNFNLTSPLARPFHALNATAVLYLQPLSPPASVTVNLTLVDVNGAATNPVASVQKTYGVTGSGYWTLFYSFPSMDYMFPAGHRIGLQVLNVVSTGQSVSLATNATAVPSRLHFETTTYVSVDVLRPALSPPTYLSPKSSLVVAANVSDPFGSSEVLAAHLNVTGPTGALASWTDPFAVVAVDPSSPSAWVLFQRTLAAPFANGTYAAEVTAVERNGPMDIADGGAIVRAPSFTLQKVASPAQGKTGTRITYYLWYNNTGSGPAGNVWLNDTLPTQVSFQNSTLPPTSGSGNAYSWSLGPVPVGSHVLQIFAQVRGGISGVGYIRNWASLNYTDPQGFLWPSLRSHADIVVNGPFLTLTQTSSANGTVHSNEPVVYSISIENTGDAASVLWVNDTVPAGLVYVSDTAGTAGGSRIFVGNEVHWTFPGMGSGTVVPVYLNFTMTARGTAGLPWGASLCNDIGLNDTSANGVLMPDLMSSLTLTVASPSIRTASAAFGVPTAVPNVGLSLYVNYTNGGNEAAGTTWLNLTLDPYLRFVSADVPAIPSGSILHLFPTNASLGSDSVRVVLAAAADITDRQTLRVSGSLVVLDGYGNVLPTVALVPGTVTVALPDVRFTISPGGTTAEAGTAIAYSVTGGNHGSGVASAVWLNLTLPTGLAYVDDMFGAEHTVIGTSHSWFWTDYAPGLRTYTLLLAADHAAVDRANATFSFHVQAFDRGGNPRPPSTFEGRVDFMAPAFRVTVWADRNATEAGGTFTYTLRATNIGSTTAQTLWLTDTIDPDLNVIYYDAPVPATGTTTLNWSLPDVGPGQTVVITIVVEVADGTPGNSEVSNTLVAQYTNSVGVVLGYAQSTPSLVRVPPNFLGLLVILLGGSALGSLVVFVVYRRYRVEIEDVFLIYHDGILVSHLTQGTALDKDEDLLSGMLTAVQDFVKDAFTYGEHRELHQLELGEYHVLIERGKLVYLAVVYRGRDSGLIRKKVRTVLDHVESAYGGVFDSWDGDMARVEGTQGLLRDGFVEDKRPWSLVKSRSG